MILTIISSLILIACLVPIFVIVGRKLSVVASIDVEAIPAERHAQVKNRIILERLGRKMQDARKLASFVFEPVLALLVRCIRPAHAFHRWVLDLREKQRKSAVIGGASLSLAALPVEERIERILVDAAINIEDERFSDAERKYIDVIALDKTLVRPYEGLARVYVAQKEWEQAKEVLLCASKLLKDHIALGGCKDAHENEELHYAEVLNDIADVYKHLSEPQKAWKCIKEAVELQNNNPKFLDALVDIHVVLGQRLKAEKALEQLRRVNPENQRLIDIEERIKELSY